MKKDVYIKGHQESINDVISFISNIMIFARFWVKISNEDHDMPLVLQMLMEIADMLSASNFLSFYDKHINIAPFISHTLITYVFNIFSIFIKMAKNPHAVRRFKIENTIDPKEIRIVKIMHNALLDQLQLCIATSSLQNLFANPTSSFKFFAQHCILKSLRIISLSATKKDLFKINIRRMMSRRKSPSVLSSMRPVKKYFFLKD